MAGPYYSKIKSTDGRVINIYHAANQPVASLLPVEANGGVLSTSEKTFTIRFPFKIGDIQSNVPDASPTHQIEIVKNDDPTGCYITFDTAYASNNSSRGNAIPDITLTPGVYKLLTRVAGPA